MLRISLLLLLSLPIASSLSNFPIVHTSYGSVRGYEYRAKNGFVGEIFKKIPFASPPVGTRRWKKPVPPERWNDTIDGTFFGPACAQNSLWKGYVTGFSEDCLTLNIYTSRECRESASSCPVVIYIHGGFALFDGTMMFPDETMVTNFASQGVIMITVAYRLGVFGVLALGDENVLPANLAIHDVLESLRFVRKEIHSFGGDRDQISVMGHSTGASIALILAFSPGINKPGEPLLFSGAILMSSTANFQSEENQVDKSHDVAKALGCTGSAQEIIECLQLLSADEILNANTTTRLMDSTIAGELLPIWSARELTENPKPIKLLLGTTVNEFEAGKSGNGVAKKEEEAIRAANTAPGETSCDKPAIEVLCVILGVRNVEECVQKCFDDCQSGAFDPGYTFVSQATYVSNLMFANAQVKAGGEVFLYQYDYPFHSLHADDVLYVMGFHEHPTDVNEDWLSRVYPLYFTNFIKGLPLAPDWNPLDPQLMNYYSVNKSFTDEVSPRTKLGYHRDITEYYEGIMKFDENLSSLKNQILNSPIQYRNSTFLSTDPFSLIDIIFYSIVLIVLLFIVYKSVRFCRQRHEEEIPLLIEIPTESRRATTEM